MKIKKAGVFLVDIRTKKIGLIYREKQQDFSFPKGHLESGETFEECAIRETQEETKRDVVLINNKPFVDTYTNPSGKECVCYMFIGLDNGPSDNTSPEVHELVWTDVEKVEETLSYESLKSMWGKIKPEILKLLN